MAQTAQDGCHDIWQVATALWRDSFAPAGSSLGGFSLSPVLVVDKCAGGLLSLPTSLPEECSTLLMPGGGVGAMSWEAPCTEWDSHFL